jgi:uncharacterized protein YcbK (DUF882 family)
MVGLDWNDPNSLLSQYFRVHEALYLPTWGRLATEDDGLTDEIKENLLDLCSKMDQIREFLGFPMNVHCMYRPPSYNLVIGAPENDVHSLGQAVDFDCNPDLTIDEIRDKVLPVLDKYNIRMERNTSTWIHLDTHPVGNARYFYP